MPENAPGPWTTVPTFSNDQMGRQTVLAYLLCGTGFRIRCLDCQRTADWSCDLMLERFAAVIGRPMSEIASRLSCRDPECRSKRLWLWPYASVKIDTGHRGGEGKAERELVILARAEEIVGKGLGEGD